MGKNTTCRHEERGARKCQGSYKILFLDQGRESSICRHDNHSDSSSLNHLLARTNNKKCKNLNSPFHHLVFRSTSPQKGALDSHDLGTATDSRPTKLCF